MTKSPFRYFKTSPEIIQLAVMMYVRFPLSLRNVEDLLHERGIDVCQGNARSVATVYSALATDRTLNGIELVSEEALNRATSIQIENEDLVLKLPMSWGIGFGINKLMHIYGPNPKAFGHHGWGGSFGFADRERGLGVSYTMNYMREPVDAPDPRVMGLIQAVFSSL